LAKIRIGSNELHNSAKKRNPNHFHPFSVGRKYQQVSLNRKKVSCGGFVAAFISAKFLSGLATWTFC